jgi:hypothetical protein
MTSMGISALSYIDPFSGSILLQVIVAGIIGVIAYFRRWIWRLLWPWSRREHSDDSTDGGEEP